MKRANQGEDAGMGEHTITLLVENEFGVLSRIVGLFTARAYNIESLTVGPARDRTLSRMTIVAAGDDQIIEQILKQLRKLVNVINVVDITEIPHVERELVLVKLRTTPQDRPEILRIAISSGPKSLTSVHSTTQSK